MTALAFVIALGAIALFIEFRALCGALAKKGKLIMGQIQDALGVAEQSAQKIADTMKTVATELDKDAKAIAWAAQQASTPDPALVARVQAHAANLGTIAAAMQSLAAAHAADAPDPVAPTDPAPAPAPVVDPAPAAPAAPSTPSPAAS